jgi:peptidoglycan/LPS O-acetylase OafA/YrhL
LDNSKETSVTKLAAGSAVEGARHRGPGKPDLYARLSVPGAAVTQHQRWASVDALRAIAALMVLASHAPWLGPTRPVAVEKVVPRLGVGVWIFFAASGYLIAGPFLRALLDGQPLPPVRRYALRRSVRILPAYWVALAAVLLLASGSALAHWWQLPVHALLIHGLVPGELKNLYLVAWSLGVEAIFYVLVPLAAWTLRRVSCGRPVPRDWLVAAVIGLWCAAVAFSVLVAVVFPVHAGRPLPGGVQVLDLVGSLANFCPGVLVFLALAAGDGGDSRWRRAYDRVVARPLPTLVLAVLLLYAATELPFETSHVAAAAQGPLMGLASGLILATFVHGAWTRPLVRVLAPVGLVSYGVYLWHWVILSALLHHRVVIEGGSGNVAIVVRIAVLVALTIPIALLSWLLVERPLLRRTTGWERRRATREGPRLRRDGHRGPTAPASGYAAAPVPASPARWSGVPVAAGADGRNPPTAADQPA